MRSDMPRVLVERPRGGWRGPFGERRRAFERKCRSRDGDDALPARMRMGFASTKWLSENLAPLRRFLMSRRDREWDDVHSEIRACLVPRSAVDMHVLQHLWDYVLFTRREPSGRVVLLDKRGRTRCELLPQDTLSDKSRLRGFFYVCCDTAVLRWVPPRRRKKRGAPDP